MTRQAGRGRCRRGGRGSLSASLERGWAAARRQRLMPLSGPTAACLGSRRRRGCRHRRYRGQDYRGGCRGLLGEVCARTLGADGDAGYRNRSRPPCPCRRRARRRPSCRRCSAIGRVYLTAASDRLEMGDPGQHCGECSERNCGCSARDVKQT